MKFRSLLGIVALLALIELSVCMRWAKSGFVNTQINRVEMGMVISAVKIDVYTGEQAIIIRDIDRIDINIEIFCFLSGYTNSSTFKFYWCSQVSGCRTIDDNIGSESYETEGWTNRYSTLFPGKKGLKMTLQFKDNFHDISGNYYCKVEDTKFAFTRISNYIQIWDKLYWEKHLYTNVVPTSITKIKKVDPTNLPMRIECNGGELNTQRPEWTKQLFYNSADWSVCPVLNNYDGLTAGQRTDKDLCSKYTVNRCDEKISDEICPKDVKEISDWTTIIDETGSLIIFALRNKWKTSDKTYMLMCYTKGGTTIQPISYYFDLKSDKNIKAGVMFDGTAVTTTRPLKLKSPLIQTLNIYATKLTTKSKADAKNPPTIFVEYEALPDAKHIWSFRGQQLNSNSNTKVTSHWVQFVGSIDSAMAGKYVLTVSHNTKQITATIILKVLGPPNLVNINCMPLIRYVPEGMDTTISCNYIDRPEELKLQINSQDITLDSDLPNSQAQLNRQYPYLSSLDFKVSPTQYKVNDTVLVDYQVNNMRKTNSQTKYQDHSVTFIATNKYGRSVRSTSLYVVPKLLLLIQDAPDKYNCTTNCFSTQQHKFSCRIRKNEYNNKELVVDHFWSINAHRLGQNSDPKNPFNNYFIVDPTTMDLTLLPVKTNNTEKDNFVKKSLKNANIQCQVTLRGPTDMKTPYLYYSVNDKTVDKILMAKITLDHIEFKSASIYIIVGVILAIILLIILIVLLSRYCMRNKGETYQLDKLERQHGYDPEKEVQEEMFKPYEREEHDPDAVANGSLAERRLSMTSHSVGSADDGELDNYELDPSKFNEDGSIIGKYGANPRNRTEMV